MSLWSFLESDPGLLVLGFVLTTVAGALLAGQVQSLAWKRQTRIDFVRRRHDEGVRLLDELSTMIGRRSFALQRLLWALPAGNAETIARLEGEYIRILPRWNSRNWTNRARIRLLVSEAQANAFLDYADDFRQDAPESLHYNFVKAHRAVMAAREGKIGVDEAQDAVDDLSHRCSVFLESLTSDLLEASESLLMLDLARVGPRAAAEPARSPAGIRAYLVDVAGWLKRERRARVRGAAADRAFGRNDARAGAGRG